MIKKGNEVVIIRSILDNVSGSIANLVVTKKNVIYFKKDFGKKKVDKKSH